ncbi:bromodomain and WD repeat-containing protein 1 [Hyla sarda]|uniref:bromodomain and WD repeat-containing protein 1 n=1 Tax=Hyla sarda TaxID=327740 RepID=UPI0024C27592|nr:bromodomain and WD repeat-containing protein 1 [Hyla sarda]
MALQPVPSCSMQPAESELYFLIARFLSKGPCAKSAQMLIQELNENNLLPNRLDWHGNEHSRTYEEMVSSNKTVTGDHLLRICQGLTRFVDKNAPVTVSRASSLLGIVNKPLCSEKGYRNTQWSHKTFATLQRGRPPEVPITARRPPNIVNVHHGKHLTGAVSFNSAFPVTMYQQIKMHKRILGHLSSVYCVAFDRTGQRIFTGSDDCLVKIWSVLDGRLLATLRGHSAEISELTVNYENTLIAASSCEKIIRVWSLRTCAPMAVLQGHLGAVTSLLFSPLVKGSTRYLVSTGGDATVCLWQWDVDTLEFNDRPQKFIERSGPGAQMLCSSCSDGGMFLAVGGSDHAIRLYYFGNDVPEKVSELEGHNDIVDSILFSYNSERFVSGSKDGIARIWRLEEQEWQSIVLDMDTNLDDRQRSNDHTSYPKPKVLMIAWNTTDSYVVTASSAHLLKVWDSHTGKLLHVLMGHENDIYVLEPHPFDSRMMLSAGHDGNIFIWDIKNGSKVTHYFNLIEGQGHGAILDCKLSADGQRIAGTDSHGYLLIFGFGNGKSYEKIPEQMFFHTDYRPLIVDGNQFVLDEQTQQAPHLMPPPFLVDVDGNPHPPTYQRLVPGRENCADEHLVPQLGYMETVDGEIVEQVVSQQTNSDQQNQDPNLRPDQRPNLEQEPGSSAQPTNAARRDLASPPNIGLRRSGQVEGVRQMHNNAPRSQIATERDLLAWRKRVVVPEITSVIYRKEEDIRIARGEQEKLFFANQKQRGLCDYSQEDNLRARNLRLRKKMASRMRPPRRDVEEFLDLSCEEDNGTRSSADEEEEEEEEAEEIENQTDNTMQSPSEDEDDWRNTSDISSEYSDWTADAGINLQPPSRNSTRRRVQRVMSSSEDESSAGERSTEEKSTPKRVRPKKSTVDSETPRSAERVPLNREISSDWRPSNWITDTTPRRSPFVPQMGDEVIYFRQGYEAYLNAVQRSNLSIGSSLKEPWKKCVLRDQELVKIVGIRYEIGPPTLCCLKLALIDHVSGKITEQSFSLKYHDMPDVIDFLVLRQFYDHARRTDWQAGNRFRSIIDDAWWFGMIVGQEPYQADYPDSLFQCYTVKWDNGEIEKLSPWDMDVIPDDVLPPEEPGASISITDEERDTLLYSPQEGEWGEGDQDSECERIICGIDQILNLDWTGPFSAPVDLSVYPAYCMMIAYPTDLSTIRMRLVNRFYRRVSALMWEVRYIEHNARTFNEPGSNITKSAKRIADLLLKFIKDSNCCSITDLSTSPEGSSEEETCNGQSENTTNSWKSRCMDLVDFLIDCEDSEPFREMVDSEQFPDYKDIIKTPMDFGTIKETLSAEGYSSPYDLCNDMRLVFSNAKLYTPNKKSRIYGMVLRLSALMEERMKGILFEYKAAQKFRMSPADWSGTKKVPGKDVQRGRRSQSVSDRKFRPERPSTSDETNQCFLEMSSPQPTSSGAACAPSPLSEASSSSRDHDGQSLCFSPASVTKSHASSRERDSSPSCSRSSGSETDSSSSTSASEHSSSSSSSSSSEINDKTDSSSASNMVNGVKTKMTNGRQQRATALKQASQGNNQRRTASSKRRISSSSESDSESTGKTHQGMRKKMLRKCAALAANKIKNMSDVENSASTSDSDCSASRNSRILPQRTAAEKAKRRLLDNSDEETGLRSDSERECPAVKAPKSQSPECRVVLTNVCPAGTFGGRILPQTRNGEVSDTESEPESPCRKRQKKLASPPRVRKQRLISDSDSLFSSSSDSSPPRQANGVPPDTESSLSDDSEDVRTNDSVAGRSRGHDSKRKRILSSCDEDWQEKDSKRPRKLTRRSKIRTRNQGKRTVRYDENPAHSDENLNGAQSRASGLQRVSHRERARQFFR